MFYKKEFPNQNNIIDAGLLNKIYCANSLDFLKTLPDNSIDIIITSPPYNFGINYDNYNDKVNWGSYFTMLFDIFRECIRVLKDSGRIAINVQPKYSEYVPIHHFISNFFIQEGLIWRGEIIWDKNHYGCHAYTYGSFSSPSAPLLKCSWEFIELFAKNSAKKIGDKNNIDIEPKEFKDWVNIKWNIQPAKHTNKYNHNAMFPEELVIRLLKLFSYKGDIVLDCFNGVGTTTKVAKELNRNFIGIDISEKYCSIARERLQEANNFFIENN